MNHATTTLKRDEGAAAPRLSPLDAFVAWLANFLRTITGMKRRQAFQPNWMDHWPGLRELECYRNQILAFAAQHVLSGGSLADRTDFDLNMEVPANYGICPRTPQAMNRRFIAMAQFRLDSSKYIHRHIRGIAKREGIALATDSNGCPVRLALHPASLSLRSEEESNPARREIGAFAPLRKVRGRWRTSSRDGGGSRARAPPAIARDCLFPFASAHFRA